MACRTEAPKPDHVLKSWPEPFQQVLDGDKRHEFRRNDRGFFSGDRILLMEWDPNSKTYTDRSIMVRIRAISYGPEWGIPVGYASFSIELESTIPPSPSTK